MDHGWGLQHDQITFGEKGGTRTLNQDSLAFQIFMDNMKLVDLDSSNGLFTWNNKRGGEYQVA